MAVASSNLYYDYHHHLGLIWTGNKMFESLTSGELTSFGLILTSAIVIVGSLWALWSEREKKSDIDVDAAVRKAPYHLLDGTNDRIGNDHPGPDAIDR